MSDFFVLGCSRSGTTMLASMLNNHPDVVVPPETWWVPTAYNMGTSAFPRKYLFRAFMHEIGVYFAGAGKAEWVEFTDAFVERHIGFLGSYRELLDCFAADAKTHFNAMTFGEKTPAHTTFVREMERSFPAYKKVILLRDPRDIVCSYFKAWFDGGNDESLRKVLKTLKCYLINIRHAHENYDYHQLKYESLTTSPADEMERLCTFLSIPFSKQMLELSPITSSRGVHSNLSKQVFPNSKKYRGILPAHYIAATEAVLAEEMELLGYSVDGNPCEHRAFVDCYLPVIEEAKIQVDEAVELKDSRNWRPSMKTRLRAVTKNVIYNRGK